MAQKHYYRDVDNSLVDLSGYAPRLNWIAQSKAEESAVGSWTVTLDDPLGELDILGHRQWFVEDDESEADDDIIFGGFVGAQTFARMDGDQRRTYGPEARVITVELYDANTWLSRHLMRGSDTDRDAETDVERMTWLLATAEAGLIDDVSTYVDTSGPVAMDATPLRGTYLGQIIADCASASGKNHYIWWEKVAGTRTLFIWYARGTFAGRESPFFITNDPADLRGTWDTGAYLEELSKDAKMRRSPDRQYCGNYATYGDKGAATFAHNATTHTLIAGAGTGHRVMTSNFPLVKTKTKAKARAARQLLDVQDQDVRITTKLIDIPSTRVTLAKAGMLVEVKGTHWGPTCDTWHEARILSAQPKPHSDGTLYDIDLELSLGDESDGPPEPPEPPFTGDAFAGAQLADGNFGPLIWTYNGDNPGPTFNTNPTVGPLSYVGSGAPGTYTQLTTSEDITVRVSARAEFATVFSAGGFARMTCTSSVNGIISQDQLNAPVGGGFKSGACVIEIASYYMVAGEVLTFSGTYLGALAGGGWGSGGANQTYIRIGRGTHMWGSVGSAEVWVGPS